MDDVLVDFTGGTGTNPLTNNDVTTSTYFVADLAVAGGDCIGYASEDGQIGIIKTITT